ncbi:MAG: hypothetical protein ABIQ35_04825 [Verrucomicrobiota bacterium]
MFRIFILSPAHSGGQRAKLLCNERAQFDLARRLRNETAPIGEVFSFLSGLYFRGKLAYAKRFANPPPDSPGVLVITPNRGLLDERTQIDLEQLRDFSGVDIDGIDPRYRRPLLRDAERVCSTMKTPFEAVLLGSIATGKYVDVLHKVFSERLRFPSEFIGRGDMSRGGLMLRCADSGTELDYIPIQGAARRGKRPDKLPPLERQIKPRK